jgi:hypothetical protein
MPDVIGRPRTGWSKGIAESKKDLELAAAFLASELMKETQSYLERGRRLQGLTDTQLASRWVVDFRAWRASRSVEGDLGDSTEMDDASAELRLRNIELPYDQIKDEMKDMVREAEQCDAEDPGISAKVGKFLDELNRRKN